MSFNKKSRRRGARALAALAFSLSVILTIAGAPARGDGDDANGALATRPASGGVVAVGGGTLPDRIYKKMIEMSGRVEPKILILPLATTEPDTAGNKTAVRFRECGGKSVDYQYFRREETSNADLLTKIRSANIIYFPGGDQKRILEILRDTPAAGAVHDVLAKGGVVGGTSAGCEVLGDLSLTGKSRLDLAVNGTSEVEPGLGLVPGVLFDQHFLRRARFLRLLSATIDSKRKIGIGVDESTAAVFPHGVRALEVIGERQVTIFRIAENTKNAPGATGDFTRAANVNLHILAEGDRYNLDRDEVLFAARPTIAPPESRERAIDESDLQPGATTSRPGNGKDAPAKPAKKD